ncbi:hypothetical protein [Saccharothrix sp. ALI-22-I]|uniref:hypothetical protein n=1 Tax=Saccharothrix sp. ALI-22-I TaxID=1933778 RepID=UPI0015C33F11|nr:hypothetical protein [Saccharothrix sp. ALI-22-I]
MRTVSRPAFIAAPLLVLAYGVIRIIDGFDEFGLAVPGPGDGAGPTWSAGPPRCLTG